MSTFALPSRTAKQQMDLNSTCNLVDSEWETLDPTPDVHALFTTFNAKFFSGKLSCVELEWSVRMYQCAGICYSRRNRMGMACVIRLSEPLLKLRSRKDLVETLLHEMIHAWNFIRGIMEENGGHGQNFLSKMHEINRIAGTNISVYHTFGDEVDLYKTHWWRCDGVCKTRKPFFGFVKRTCNRAPGKNDRWWSQHEQTCGGTFIKVKEPEKTVKKSKTKEIGSGNESKKKKVSASPKNSKTSPGSDIRKFFKPTPDNDSSSSDKGAASSTGSFKTPIKKALPPIDTNKPTSSMIPAAGGHTLGGQSSGRSRLLDMFEDKRKKTVDNPKKRKIPSDGASSFETIVIDSSFEIPHTSFHDRIKLEFAEVDGDIIFIDDEFDDTFLSTTPKAISEVLPKPSDLCHCPCCNMSIEISKVNEHLDQCLGM